MLGLSMIFVVIATTVIILLNFERAHEAEVLSFILLLLSFILSIVLTEFRLKRHFS